MKQEINSGRVFVENGTRIPIFLAAESRPYLSGWVSMEGVAWRQFRKDLNAAGWTYFNIGIELKVTVFGFDRQGCFPGLFRDSLNLRHHERVTAWN
jgi:hypothetical protein